MAGAIAIGPVDHLGFPKLTDDILTRVARNCFHASMLHQFPGRTMGPLEMYDPDRQAEWYEIARAAYVTLAVEAGADAREIPDSDDEPPPAVVPPEAT